MSYTKPGVRARRQDVIAAITTEDAELSGGLVGPIYQVVEGVATAEDYDALDPAVQLFVWPSLKAGAVVDLSGTRNGYIDSQRKEFAPYPLTFRLLDQATGIVHPVSDAHVEQVNQAGFGLTALAKTGLQRAQLSAWAIQLFDRILFYRPPIAGTVGFSQLFIEDRFLFAAEEFSATSLSDVWLGTNVQPSAPSASTFVDSDGTQQVDVALGSSAGRIVVSVAVSDFPTLEPAFGLGDPAVVYAPKAGFVGVAGQVGVNTAELTTLVLSQGFAPSDIIGRTVKIENTTASTVVWSRVVDFDPTGLTLEVGASVGAATNVVSITVYDDVVGYAESFNNAGDEVTLVVPRTFSTAETAIELYPAATSITFWPVFSATAQYRALRASLANQAVQVASLAELLEYLGETSVKPADGLGYIARLNLQAQGSQRNIWLIPVDTEPSGDMTGLPENQDLVAGYTEALEAAEGVELYSLVCMDVDRPAIQSVYRAHIDAMNLPEAQRERFGWLINKVPLGAYESEGGIIAPGQTLTGTATSTTQGNKWITDPSIDFVSEAGVVAGTRVVVVSPARFAGSYIAHADTTDDVLVLSGDDWEIERYGERPSVGLTIATSSGLHTLSGAAAGHWRDVEPGDYLHITINTVTYRLRVTSVPGNASTLVCVDEAPGDLNFTGGTLAGNVFVIRSYGSQGNPPNVSYYIRPLTKQQQVNQLIAAKSVNSSGYSLLLDYEPLVDLGTSTQRLSSVATLAIMSGLRTGSNSFEDITQLTMGASVREVRWGYNHFKEGQLNSLAEQGFWLITQDVQGQEPYIRDSLTSSTGAPAQREEVVRANSAWQIKTLRLRFKKPVGQRMANNTAALRGLRVLQLRVILKEFVDDGRLLDYTDDTLELDASDPTRNNIFYNGIFPVAEKRLEFTVGVTTQSEGA